MDRMDHEPKTQSQKSRRILIGGVGPIPIENPEFLHGTCWRSWQLAKALHDDGHDLLFLCFRVTGSEGAKSREANREIRLERLRYVSLTEEEFVHLPLIARYYDEFQPELVVGANTYPSSILAQLDPPVPFWADINGFHMGEAQAKAVRYGNDYMVKHYWDILLPNLMAGDHFSVPSAIQKGVLIGELDQAGRLNRHTFGCEFVSFVPEARDPVDLESLAKERLIRGVIASEDSFLALWLGGYNLWCDMDTLFEGLERAMARNARIHFVSTGGAIEGQDDFTFGRFHARIQASLHRERFHFLGWVPSEKVDAFCRECDVGLNVDGRCYEVLYGARNRITDFMKLGLPTITTIGPEISEVVARENAGWGFAIGDAPALAEALAFAAEHPDEAARRGANARRFFEQHYTIAEATRPLRDWAAGEPVKARDWHQPNAAGWPLPLRVRDFEHMSPLRRWAYYYAKYGARGLLRRAWNDRVEAKRPESI
jgi:glycosyltransferase involved in cell wall biosynthesis